MRQDVSEVGVWGGWGVGSYGAQRVWWGDVRCTGSWRRLPGV